MKHYFFGYLFVRLAKLVAVLVVAIGVVFAVVRFWQAGIQAETNRYQTSDALQHQLARLTRKYHSALGHLSEVSIEKNIRSSPAPQFSSFIQSRRDFDRLRADLLRLRTQSGQVKQAVVQPFESSVRQIEEKLRSHAASIKAEANSLKIQPTPTPTPPPLAVQAAEPERLYSDDIDMAKINARISDLQKARKFLKAVQEQTENPENWQTLERSTAELDNLQKILANAIPLTIQRDTETTPKPSTNVVPPLKVLDAEKVLAQLLQLTEFVREAVLSSWALDEAIDQADEMTSTEANKLRLMLLTVRGIWLAALMQIFLGLLIAVFLAFLVLVMADLTQTFLDTATNTRIIADRS